MSPTDERRLVTALFADLVGFTGRAEASDPELVREIQQAYFEAVAAEVERYGGVIEKYIGDAAMSIFGIPQAHDDDAERALHAALRIRDAVAGLGHDLQIRIGVNTGEVVGGSGAGPHGGEYTVTGDPINVAARLEQAAPPGEIYVGGATRRLASAAFDFGLLEPLELKGKANTVEAWRLLRELPERPRLRGGEAPLVGRQRELATLESALDQAISGRGLLLALVGEAGIGKSRLALEQRARAELQGFMSTWSTARSYSSAFPYHVVAQLAEAFLSRRPGQPVHDALTAGGVNGDPQTLARWAAVLGEVLGEPPHDGVLAELTPSGRQHVLVQAIHALLQARAGARPLLMVLDDLQWADATSLSVLDEVIDAVVGLPVLVLMLYRSGWSHGWAGKSFYQQLNLAGLRPDEARELAAHLGGANAVPADVAERVLDRSGGNPFFLEELLKADASTPGQGGTRLPETVHEVVLARIDALPQRARQVLQLAAVIGVEFSEPVLAGVEPEGDLPDALRTLQREDLVLPRSAGVDERRFVFRHPLIQEVAYRSLLVTKRRELHGRIARWLEDHGGDESVQDLAAHYRDSDDTEKAREYLPRAAERAASLNASYEALELYQQAADLLSDEPRRRGQMLERAAHHSYLIGNLPGAIDLVQQAAGLYASAGDELHALDCRRWLGRYYWMHGRGEEADREIAAAIEGLERLPPSRELALAYSYRSQLRMLSPDFTAGVAWARKAIAMAEQTGATDALVHAYNNLGSSLNGLGDPTGIEYLRRSLALALEHNLPDDAGRAFVNLCGQGSQVVLFEYSEAEAFLEEARAYAQRTIPGGVFDQWIRAGQAEFWLATGRWDEADRAFAELAEIVRANQYVTVDVAAHRSLLASFRGQFDLASELVANAVEPALRIGDLQAFVPVFAALAHAEAGLGRPEAALRAIGRAIELIGETEEAYISSWFLFQATDTLTSLLIADEQPGAGGVAQQALSVLAAYTTRLAPVAARGAPSDAADRVRGALFGAAAEQIQAIARRLDAPAPELGSTADRFPGRERAAGVLDQAHRLFDAAQVRLWLAEESRDAALLGDAPSVFERLGAPGHLRRAAALAR